MEKWLKRIQNILEKSGKKGLSFHKLQKKCKIGKGDLKKFTAAVDHALDSGMIYEREGHLVSVASMGLQTAVISRLNRTYGFAALKNGQEVFILGSRLLGALPGDKVLIRLSGAKSRGNLPEGEVFRITEPAEAEISGRLEVQDGGTFFLPDALGDFPLRVVGGHKCAENGDKVLAHIIRRGTRHRDHLAEITACFGSSKSASACAQAILASAGVSQEFPSAVVDEAKFLDHRGIQDQERMSRLDLRDEIIFTIDGADAKDLDDAISLEKYDGLYYLGVHIADVSHYVRAHSLLDEEAFARGTSIYYADQVIPMLPKELSNGICSLNPQEERLAFSALMTLSSEGKLMNYEFRKTIIRSRVKGVYSEVNAILDGTADEAVHAKYREVEHMIPLLRELQQLRLKLRQQRGAPTIESTESRIVLDEQGHTADIQPRTTGETESIIEECMLLANEAAAALAAKEHIPFVYRVHEHPDPERITTLREILGKLNLPCTLPEKVRPGDLAELLDKVRGEAAAPIINHQVLRSMAKARYSEQPLGHFGLALEDYAHFTAPIRRYPDLTIHRILTSLCEKDSLRDMHKRYTRFAARSAEQSSETELKAMEIERNCEDCYKAEYMASKVGEEFDGIISSVTSFGIYVELPNTVEGLVRLEDLPGGEYVYDGMIELAEMQGSRRFRLGDPVRICCTGTDVNSGRIDFSLV